MTITKPHQHPISALASIFALAALATSLAQAQTFTILHRFANSEFPTTLIADPGGNFYGTTEGGGPSNAGTVFRLDRTGYTVLYSFTGGTDGSNPWRSLVRDSAGGLYGITESGGNTTCSNGYETGCGVVYKLYPTGVLTVLHTFNWTVGTVPDAAYPRGLIRGPQGNLYGFTIDGGTPDNGLVFQLDPSGAETMLHSLAHGQSPLSLILDPAGALYGTTLYGGAGEGDGGVVYKLDQTGERVLYSFTNETTAPHNPILWIRDSTGNLYGTLESGGSSNRGEVFELDTNGTFTVLHTFTGADGLGPVSLILGSDGNLYGTTGWGGNSTQCLGGCGVIFELDTAGTFTVLYNFQGKADGSYPNSLIRGPEGNLYGLAAGANNNPSVVFRIRP